MNDVRLPPQNLDLERAVLGAVLIDPDAIGILSPILPLEAFYHSHHRLLWSVMLKMARRGEPIDTLTVCMLLGDRVDEVGGAVFISTLASSVGTSVNAEYHARLLRDLHTKRNLIVQAHQLSESCYAPHEPLEDILKQANGLSVIPSLSSAVLPRPTWELVGDTIDDTLSAIERRQGNFEPGGIPTGLRDLDEVLDGLQPSDSIVVAGRTSEGKTALGLVIAWNVSKALPVGFISVEMNTKALNQRLLAMISGVDSHQMRRGRLGPEQVRDLGDAARSIKQRPLFIAETLREPGHILRESLKLHQEHGIGLLVIDYLQLLEAPTQDMRQAGRNREQEVSAVSRAIKALAKELRIPVVTLAQLSRSPDRRENKRPILSDLRESGSIEMDADVVILIHRPYRRGESDIDGQSTEYLLEANVAKQRNGPIEEVKLDFNDATGRITNWGGRR